MCSASEPSHEQKISAEALRLTTPLKEIEGLGVGARRATQLKRLGLVTVYDLLRHLPMRYEHEFSEGAINDLPMDAIGSARGTIVNTRVAHAVGHKGRARFEATLQDHSTTLRLVWFNATYLHKQLHPGMVVRVTGKTTVHGTYPQMVNPKWEDLTKQAQAPATSDRLRPVYPASQEISSAFIEQMAARIVPAILNLVHDPLTDTFRKARELPTLAEAYRMLHRPEHADEVGSGRRRLAYNECLLLQLGITLKRHYNDTQLVAPGLRWSDAVDRHIRARFPFTLTPAQDTAVKEIAGDLRKSRPMNRLLQGDVGAGKTVVALYALLMAVADRKQGAIMAPTELLAEQHFASISSMLEGSNVKIALLTGGASASRSAERQALLEQIASSSVEIIVGTQALLTESVRFADLGVVVVDEQHRFGVLQRAAFRSRMGRGTEQDGRKPSPHYLVMTATPIPRTLSLTLFGDLDVSTIKGLPPGRTPITTRVVPPEGCDKVYGYLAQRVEKGEQLYVVVPAIDPSSPAPDSDSAKQLKSVNEHAKLLGERYFKGVRIATVHGRLKPETRAHVMDRFRRGEVKVLVATTVIEVGVDVPNATLMVVEHAERFGLSQLHQLRGRIGRGDHGRKSLCVFIASPTTDDAQRRMKAIAATTDGFAIAEEDLAIRGMGDFFGTRQSGMPPLRVARIPDDIDLFTMARRDAGEMVEADPQLQRPEHVALRKVLMQQYGDVLGLIDVG
ncbi:MAG: ATP-dependent DNA helicase RecG [Phycisphaera sp.]|nr:ATP-dependent DNA helicase RecG [Phycisphaera sp.]